MPTCRYCGATAEDDDLFCPQCGEPLSTEADHFFQVDDGAARMESEASGPTAVFRALVETGGDRVVIGAQAKGEVDLSGLDGLFRSQGDQVIVRPQVDVTMVEAPQAIYCSVCRGYHPQEELFRCPDCNEEVGVDHRVEGLGICSRCAAIVYEVTVRFVPELDSSSRCRLLLLSNLVDAEWQREAEFDSSLLPWDWEDRLTRIAQQETVPERELIEQVGQPLFQAILGTGFWPELERQFQQRREWQGVLIRLADLPSELSRWPWEFLCRGDDFLALSPHTPIVRWIERNGVATLTPESKPLRILVVAARDGALGAAPSAGEVDLLRSGLETLDTPSTLEFEPLRITRGPVAAPSPADALRWHLLQSRHHVLHLCGGLELEFNEQGDPTLLLQDGEACERLKLGTLGHWLEDSSVQVVVLGCRFVSSGQEISPFDPRLKLENWLLRGRVVAVVALQYETLPDKVRSFAQAFYMRLAVSSSLGFPKAKLPEALAAGRKALLDPGLGAGTTAWAAPVLLARPFEGPFLELVAPPEAEAAVPSPSFEPFVEEPVVQVDPAEAPKCLNRAIQALLEHRVQLIVGEPDAGALDLARQLARSLIDAGACDLAVRFPRYEPPAGFLANLRDVARRRERLAVLFEVEKWERSTEEFDAIVRLAAERTVPIYILIAVNIDPALDVSGEFGLWRQQNPSLWTPLGRDGYDSPALQQTLKRLVQQARLTAQLHPATAIALTQFAEKNKLFGSGRSEIAMPGQLLRLVYGHLVGQPAISDEKRLKEVLDTLSDAHEDLRRWFSERLNNSQRVLIMALALLQGLPLHLFLNPYRNTVMRLRQAFHLDLSVLPVRAELRSYSLYLEESQRKADLGEDTSFIEFSSEMVETEILVLLRRDYSEWLLELVPLLGDLVCSNAQLDSKPSARSEAEQRVVLAAAARGLGEIGCGSRRALGLVMADVERWLLEPHPQIAKRTEHQLGAVPGHILRYVAEADDSGLEVEILSTLARWRRHEHYKMRWAAASACGRLARVIPAKRLLPIFLALARDAQESSRRVFQDSLRRTRDTRKAAAANEYQTEVEVYQAAIYALRMFAASDFGALQHLYDQAAADGNLGVRINAAIALDQLAADRPDVARQVLLRWANYRNRANAQERAAWWTAVLVAVHLTEHERLAKEPLRDLWRELLAIADQLSGAGHPERMDRIAGDIVWAMGTFVGRESGSQSEPIALERTFVLLGDLLGADSWQDDVLRAVFRRAAAADAQQQLSIVKAVFATMQNWLQPQHYQLVPYCRRVAVEAYLNAGPARWNEAVRLLRSLAQFEGFDYRIMLGRDVDTLNPEWLGVGGLIMRAILEGREEVLGNALPLLRTLASVKEPLVRSLAPFVLSALGSVHATPVQGALNTWAQGPQWTLQQSAAEAALGLCLVGGALAAPALDVLARLAAEASADVRAYLDSQLGDLAAVDLPAATRLRELLGSGEAPEGV